VSLVCPTCGSDEFRIRDSVEMGPESDWHERPVQRARCGTCGVRFFCSYQERRSFRMDREDTVEHLAYVASAVQWHVVSFAFERPQRRVSAPWRRRWASRVMARCRRIGDPLVIRYGRGAMD